MNETPKRGRAGDGKYVPIITKLSPQTYAALVRIEKKKGLSKYGLLQLVADTLVRYMDDAHNLTPEMEQAMSIFEHMEGWRDALNFADHSVNKMIGEAVYFLFDADGKRKGCRAIHVQRPFFGNWTEDMNVQHILERVLCLMLPEQYRRLRSLAVDMECSSLLELFTKLIDHHGADSDVAMYRQLFEDADRSEYGREPHKAPFKIHHKRSVDEMETPDLFGGEEGGEDDNT